MNSLLRTTTTCLPSTECNHLFFYSCRSDFSDVYTIWVALHTIPYLVLTLRSLLTSIRKITKNKYQIEDLPKHQCEIVISLLCCLSSLIGVIHSTLYSHGLDATDLFIPPLLQQIFPYTNGVCIDVTISLLLAYLWGQDLSTQVVNIGEIAITAAPGLYTRISRSMGVLLLVTISINTIAVRIPSWEHYAYMLLMVFYTLYVLTLSGLHIRYRKIIASTSKVIVRVNSTRYIKTLEYTIVTYILCTLGILYILVMVAQSVVLTLRYRINDTAAFLIRNDDILTSTNTLISWHPYYTMYITTIALVERQVVILCYLFIICQDTRACIRKYMCCNRLVPSSYNNKLVPMGASVVHQPSKTCTTVTVVNTNTNSRPCNKSIRSSRQGNSNSRVGPVNNSTK